MIKLFYMERMNNTQTEGQNKDDQWTNLTGLSMEEARTENLAPRTFVEFNRIADETNIAILSHLNSTNPEAKTEFLADPTLPRPNNEWKKLRSPQDYEENLEALEQATIELADTQDLPYREKLLLGLEYDFIRKKNRLALATAKFNSALAPEEKEAARVEHRAANIELYGMPDKDTFYSLLRHKIDKIDLDALTDEDKRQYDELMEMLGDMPTEIKPLYAPKQETIDRFSEMVRIFYEPFLKHIPDDKEVFTAQDAADIVNEAISSEVGGRTEWHAEVSPNAGFASVSSKKKAVNFPGARSRGDYSRLELEKIIVHELGTHAFRSMPYEDASIEAFRSGRLAGYGMFEEGIAKVMEQSLEGRYEDPDSPAPSRYIMIGLANLKDMDFRQTFEIMKRLERLTDGWNEGQIYDNLQRTYRGTGVLPNNKDLYYYNGNVQAWKFIEEDIDDPWLFDRIFLSGKINPLDHDQEYLSYEMKNGAMRG